MKTPIYTLLLIALSVLSCSVDNINEDVNNLDTLNNDNSQKILDLPMDDNVCTRTALMVDGKEIGVVDFSFEDYQVIITYKTIDSWKMISTNLGLIDMANDSFSLSASGTPMIHDFYYQDSYNEGQHEVTYVIDENSFVENYAYVAYAIVIGPNYEKAEAWGHGNLFNDQSDAMYGQINTLKCRADDYEDGPGQLDYCNADNTKAYICHNGNTICINVDSIEDHLAHGDILGKCEE